MEFVAAVDGDDIGVVDDNDDIDNENDDSNDDEDDDLNEDLGESRSDSGDDCGDEHDCIEHSKGLDGAEISPHLSTTLSGEQIGKVEPHHVQSFLQALCWVAFMYKSATVPCQSFMAIQPQGGMSLNDIMVFCSEWEGRVPPSNIIPVPTSSVPALSWEEALLLIIELLESFSQNACGGYKNKRFFYSNSFLMADSTEAFVLETAGEFWAWKKLDKAYSISNALSLQTDFDDSNAGGLLKGKGFTPRFSDRLYTLAGRAGRRRACTLDVAQGEPDLAKAISTLQSHHLSATTFSPGKATTACICMHATSFLNPSSTTGSMVAEVPFHSSPRIWLTGTPYPCISLFKPFHFHQDPPPLQAPGGKPDDSLWWKGQQRYEHILPSFRNVFLHLQTERQKKQKVLIDLAGHTWISVAEIERQALHIEQEWHNLVMSL
jgi:hypothetical protein